MGAFNDRTCEGCGESYGWQGELRDCPPCPGCGHAPPDAEAMEAVEREMAKARAKIVAKAAAEWSSRTPAQDAAYRAGAQAYQANRDSLVGGGGQRAVSWVVVRAGAWRDAQLQDELRPWFNHGWHAAEFDSVRPVKP